MADESHEDGVLTRIREAIRKAGGVPVVSERTGIPRKTLEKYLAKRSMPSFENAAKIAAAAGMSVGELAGELGRTGASPGAISAATEIVQMVGVTVSALHRVEGVKLPEGALVDEIARAYAALLQRMDDPGDVEEARALLPWLEGRLKKSLREAVATPGTGKREAS